MLDYFNDPPQPKWSITAEDSDVVIRVKVWAAGNTEFSFRFAAGSAWAAVMLRDAIHGQLSEVMERARRDAYMAGWSDKTKRKPKKGFFWGRHP